MIYDFKEIMNGQFRNQGFSQPINRKSQIRSQIINRNSRVYALRIIALADSQLIASIKRYINRNFKIPTDFGINRFELKDTDLSNRHELKQDRKLTKDKTWIEKFSL